MFISRTSSDDHLARGYKRQRLDKPAAGAPKDTNPPYYKEIDTRQAPATDASPPLAGPSQGLERPRSASPALRHKPTAVAAQKAHVAAHSFVSMRRAILDGDYGAFAAEIAGAPKAALNGSDPLSGKTLVHVAVEKNRLDMLQTLLAADAPLNKSDKRYWRAPLHTAIHLDNVPAASILLVHQADTSVKDFNGYTPLQTAVADEKPEFVALLQAYGADASRSTKHINPRGVNAKGELIEEVVPSALKLAAQVRADTLAVQLAGATLDDTER